MGLVIPPGRVHGRILDDQGALGVLQHLGAEGHGGLVHRRIGAGAFGRGPPEGLPAQVRDPRHHGPVHAQLLDQQGQPVVEELGRIREGAIHQPPQGTQMPLGHGLRFPLTGPFHRLNPPARRGGTGPFRSRPCIVAGSQ